MYVRTLHQLRCLQHTAHLSDEALITIHGASALPGTRHQLPTACSVQRCIDTAQQPPEDEKKKKKKNNR